MDSKDSQTRHFSRRLTAAVQGLHLPSEEELLRGMNFFRNDLDEDIREYAERLSRRIRKRGDPALASVAAALEELTVEQSDDGLQSLVECLDGVEEVNGVPIETCRMRCQYYLASFGDPDAAASIAGEAATVALRDINESDNLRMIGRALGWGVMARSLAHAVKVDGLYASRRSLSHMLHGYERDFEAAIQRAVRKREPEQKEVPVDDAFVLDLEDETAGAAEMDGSVVVFTSIGNDTTSEGKRVVKEFEKSVQRRLPLPITPDLAAVWTRLTTEFPWAMSIADEILKGLVGRDHVLIRPTVLLGPPGCGKTRFSRRLIEELGIPYELVSCGGLSDSALGGTPRRWSSGEPSLAVMAVRRHECAGPAIILDEIEKVGNSRHNGNVHDVLVGLLEKETSMIQPEGATPDVATIERVLRPLARKAGGLNGADIEAVVKNARRRARREKRAVTYDDIESLLAGTKQPRSMRLLHRIAVHEAGHAVARLHFRLGPIIEITVDAPDGGYTLGELGHDEQTEELLTTILIEHLAGRAAEEEILGSATSNSGGSERSDLALVTKLVLDMETILGFSPKWPLLYRKVESGTAILGTDLDLAESVNARIDIAYKAARGLVAKQRAAIDFLANTLVAQETLEGPELDAVLEQVKQKMVDPPK